MFGIYSYLVWMLIFTGAAIAILWTRYWRVLWLNRLAIGIVTVLGAVFQLISDPFAERWHAWFFDDTRVVGLWIGNFPVENIMFFALTAFTIASFIVSRVARGRY